LAWLQAYSVNVLKPKDDFGIANAEGFKSYMFGQTCRPMLPGYLPGRSTYLWLDADTWVQDVSVIQDFVAIAAEGKAAAVLELDPSYPWYFRRASAFHGYKIKQWTAAFGPEVARQLHLATLLNSGVLAMSGDSPLWKRWGDNLALSLTRGPTHLSEQLALQKTSCFFGYARNLSPARASLRRRRLPFARGGARGTTRRLPGRATATCYWLGPGGKAG
jgi:hypothetical protein